MVLNTSGVIWNFCNDNSNCYYLSPLWIFPFLEFSIEFHFRLYIVVTYEIFKEIIILSYHDFEPHKKYHHHKLTRLSYHLKLS